MLFNSIDFAVFLPLVFVAYWYVLREYHHRNVLLLLASYVFYGWWDWRFLSLILFSTVVDFAIGRRLGKEEDSGRRRVLLWVSIVVNLGFLGFFKYFNFFLENFTTAFSFFGQPISVRALSIALPVGISFYTFQTLSYSIDVYRRKLPAAKNFVAFAAFVSFFPQLVAGPIERATNLLPQFQRPRTFDYSLAVLGLRQILWGLFKKIVIADNCAVLASQIFDGSDGYSGSTLLLGAVLFGFQIYGDFSGYSDIAIGTARLFGFRLMQNFAFPYFSRNIAEFWRRWHISLSTWFRDYLYIPLGGSRGGRWRSVRNVFIIFLVSGFWHGANWTFLAWGGLHALFFLPLLLTDNNRSHLDTVATGRWFPTLRETIGMLTTFGLVTLAWVFFRAENMGHALSYLQGIFSPSIFSLPEERPLILLLLLIFFLGVEWFGREGSFAIERFPVRWGGLQRWAFYYLLLLIMVLRGGVPQEFIYFQF